MQKEALRAYCLEHGIQVDQWVEDVGAALNYKRQGFHQVIQEIELGQVHFDRQAVALGFFAKEKTVCTKSFSSSMRSIGL